MHFDVSKKVHRIFCGVLRAFKKSHVFIAILPGWKWSVLLQRLVIQDENGRRLEVVSAVECEGVCGRPVCRKNKELPDVTMKVFEKLGIAMSKEGSLLSLNERGMEGKNKMIASCCYREQRPEDYCEKFGVGLPACVHDVFTRTARLGAMLEGKRLNSKKFHHQENQKLFQESTSGTESTSC